jgi:hypothetical protein
LQVEQNMKLGRVNDMQGFEIRRLKELWPELDVDCEPSYWKSTKGQCEGSIPVAVKCRNAGGGVKNSQK